jgi:D-arabinose 1-dehydrogenase-like Zn-dependent alcohol dehydrogenase
VIGIVGLGRMALQVFSAWGCEVTVNNMKKHIA